MEHEKLNILLVDDQPAKLLSHEVVLRDLDENLIKAASASEALRILLNTEVAVILVDVCMPEFDGFELASMIREHPRFQRTAIIFISAIHLTEADYLRGYEMGGVDYVSVPVIPELLRAKVKIFAELYRKTRQLENLNRELEARVAERTAEVQASSERLRESERGRSLALAAGQMGSLEWDIGTGECVCDAGLCRIVGLAAPDTVSTVGDLCKFIDRKEFARIEQLIHTSERFQAEIAVIRPGGELRTCFCAGAVSPRADGRASRVSMVLVDITERKQAEERHLLLAREVDHRARNALAIVQAIVRLTKSSSQQEYMHAVEGRIQALAQAHTLLSESRWQGADIKRLVAEEVAPYRGSESARVRLEGQAISLPPEKSQNLALVLHELATNSAKYGALSASEGSVVVRWDVEAGMLTLRWEESGGPPVTPPTSQGFGTKIMNASIKHQIGGNVAWDWRATGLHCTLQIPISEGDRSDIVSVPDVVVQLAGSGKRRVLLVENEAVTGMMFSELLVERGMHVIGPCCSVQEALAAANADFEAAFLDLNLGGESGYPVAHLLKQKNIPFTFVTGYSPEVIDPQFSDVHVLQKPITRESFEARLDAMLGLTNEPAEILAPDAESRRASAGRA